MDWQALRRFLQIFIAVFGWALLMAAIPVVLGLWLGLWACIAGFAAVVIATLWWAFSEPRP